MWHFVLQSLRHRRGRSAALVLGVGLGVGLLFALVILNLGVTRGLENARRYLGADLLVVPSRAAIDVEQAFFSGAPLRVYLQRDLAAHAREIRGVKRVGTQFFTQTLELLCCGSLPEVRIVGVDDVSASFLPLGEGERAPQADEVLVGASIIDDVGWKGSRIELLGDIFRVATVLRPTGVGIDRSILMPIDTARRLASASPALQPLWSESGPPDTLVSALLIELEHPPQAEIVSAELERLAPVRVIRPAESFQRLRAAADSFGLVLLIASLLPAAAGLAYLFSQVTVGAWDRKGEWALYRALGASRRQLAGLVVGEAVLLGAGGAVVGVLVGGGLYRWAAPRLLVGHPFPFVAPAVEVIAAVAAGVVALYGLIGIAAALLPAWRVARAEPSRLIALGEIDS